MAIAEILPGTAIFDLLYNKRILNKYIDVIEEHLSSFNFGDEPGELYEPIRYILSLGGKRLRPVLALMSCEMFDEDFSKAIYPALGVEVFHNFTLLHDDIMDNAPVRRGQKRFMKSGMKT